MHRNRYNHSRANRLRRDLNPGLTVSSHASSPLDYVDMSSHAYLVVMVPMEHRIHLLASTTGFRLVVSRDESNRLTPLIESMSDIGIQTFRLSEPLRSQSIRVQLTTAIFKEGQTGGGTD